MTEIERNALISFAVSLGVPFRFTQDPDGYHVFLGVENMAQEHGYSEYQDAIAFLTSILTHGRYSSG